MIQEWIKPHLKDNANGNICMGETFSSSESCNAFLPKVDENLCDGWITETVFLPMHLYYNKTNIKTGLFF